MACPRVKKNKLPIAFKAQVSQVRKYVRPMYSRHLIHHNFTHADKVYATAMDLAESFKANGHTVNKQVLAFASYFHDVYSRDSLPSTYNSPEERSAEIAFCYLTRKGYDKESIAIPVKRLVESTHCDAPCETVEAIILRMADIGNVAGPYSYFLLTSKNLWEEDCKFSGDICFEEWSARCYPVLQKYLSTNKLPKNFSEAAYKNIKRLHQEFPAINDYLLSFCD